ncbi:MAG TPA: succinyldiaminopimelate transaminase [Limnobacter sp.]|uniref:succinyldiaminopimelate transaminase n=1 Tax=Limnobacter sp. TaxID=2003368 RepID=UPI002E31D56E|nr:succinyldiaminopimelate transaminase [Limnobacter sp.]HEX5484590.1 succinyldiaminopimelate transaminase [Limnobacter sp.]
MNPNLDKLQAYPFERLAKLFAGVTPNPALRPISLSIGEPKHPTPEVIRNALCSHIDGLAVYPGTKGLPVLRQTISQWINRRFDAHIDPETQVLPILGSREALFSFAQTVLGECEKGTRVAFPNPFYQIYEGAAFLGGAEPVFVNIDADTGLADFSALSDEVLDQVALLYVCSPNNPTGAVMSLDDWQTLFDLADKHDFVIASDECYSEIYFDESDPPIGGLEAASRLGRSDYNNLVVFSSLSKRSNAPGLRSGYVAGDADLISKFLLYRTYHGSAMSVTVQHASVAAWSDEVHVQQNRELYRQKFQAFQSILKDTLPLTMPEAGFYFWAKVPDSDTQFALDLYQQQNVTVLPGSYLGRECNGHNPGEGHVRLALVASVEDCNEAAHRIKALLSAGH